MESTSRSGHGYHDVRIGGSGRAHLGDVHYNYGPSSDERILNGILDSLSYPGMNDRRDALTEAHKGTFDRTFLEGKTKFITERYIMGQSEMKSALEVQMSFKSFNKTPVTGCSILLGNQARESRPSCKTALRPMIQRLHSCSLRD